MGFYLILTSAAVSLDGFVAGLSIGMSKREIKRVLPGTLTAVTAVCFCAYTAALELANGLSSLAQTIGGLLLVAIGTAQLAKETLFPAEKTAMIEPKKPFNARKRALNSFLSGFITGLGVGADGGVACVSLALLGYGMLSAVTVTLFHYAFISAGVAAAKLPVAGDLKIKKYAPILLVVLGASRII